VSNVAPVLVSVIVLAVQDYARKAVMEQVDLRKRIENLVREALQPVEAARRIVLETPQGMAVALLDRPRAALDFAERVMAGADGLPLCIGINHGPVTIAEEASRGKALVGDGIAAGMTMAQAAVPGKMIASRAFRDALETDAPDSAARLGAAGVHTDAHVRSHELYTLDRRAAGARRWRLAFVGVAVFSVILALGFVARLALYGGGLRGGPAPAGITLQIAPHGDVYIDGVLKGSSPPLTRVEVTPGPHTIEVLNGQHPPMRVDVNPGPAEELTVAHIFIAPRILARPRESPPPAREKSLTENVRDNWRSIRRQVGF